VGFQLPPAYQGLSVGDLEDPGTRGAFGGIKESAPAVDVKKDFLNKVIRLRSVTENSSANILDTTGITSEEQSERITVACMNAID
jgi:hypothetical protein